MFTHVQTRNSYEQNITSMLIRVGLFASRMRYTRTYKIFREYRDKSKMAQTNESYSANYNRDFSQIYLKAFHVDVCVRRVGNTSEMVYFSQSLLCLGSFEYKFRIILIIFDRICWKTYVKLVVHGFAEWKSCNWYINARFVRFFEDLRFCSTDFTVILLMPFFFCGLLEFSWFENPCQIFCEKTTPKTTQNIHTKTNANITPTISGQNTRD